MTTAEQITKLAAVIARQEALLSISERTRELQNKLFAEHQERLEELTAERDALLTERERANHAVEKALTATVKSKLTRGAFRESFAKWMVTK